jgi:hypothetical protein
MKKYFLILTLIVIIISCKSSSISSSFRPIRFYFSGMKDSSINRSIFHDSISFSCSDKSIKLFSAYVYFQIDSNIVKPDFLIGNEPIIGKRINEFRKTRKKSYITFDDITYYDSANIKHYVSAISYKVVD